MTWRTDNPIGDVLFPTCPRCHGTTAYIHEDVRQCWTCKPERVVMIVRESMSSRPHAVHEGPDWTEVVTELRALADKIEERSK